MTAFISARIPSETRQFLILDNILKSKSAMMARTLNIKSRWGWCGYLSNMAILFIFFKLDFHVR